VYALNRDPAEDFAVIDAYPDRELHRYAYRGVWTPNPNRHVAPKLESLDVREGARIDASTTVGVPDRVQRAVVRLETDRGDGHAEYDVSDPDDSLAVDWSVGPDGARLAGDPNATVPIDPEGDEVIVTTVTLVDPGARRSPTGRRRRFDRRTRASMATASRSSAAGASRPSVGS